MIIVINDLFYFDKSVTICKDSCLSIKIMITTDPKWSVFISDQLNIGPECFLTILFQNFGKPLR